MRLCHRSLTEILRDLFSVNFVMFELKTDTSDSLTLIRIPSCFLLIGGITAALCLTGVLLVSPCEDDLSVSSQELPSLSVVEVLRTRVFYQVGRGKTRPRLAQCLQIWFGFFAVSVTQGLLINWQKSYGLLLVTSDTFHANIGIFTNICNGVCRVVWGGLYDRIGYKKCLVIISLSVSLGVSSLPLLKFLGKKMSTVLSTWTCPRG